MRKQKMLMIVAGAAGEIGTAFCRETIKNNIDCIGIARNSLINLNSPIFTQVVCNLQSEKSIQNAFVNVDFAKYKKIIYLHAIGTDKFEPRGYPNIQPIETIPEDVYNTNVNTFKYLLRYCVHRIKGSNEKNNSNTKFRVAIVAGVPDKYSPFVIESFCEAKFILRQYIQSSISMFPSWISGLSINVTSTITKAAVRMRPYADTTYWLNPEEVVEKSFNELISKFSNYKEINITKDSPDYFEGYYLSKEALYEKWSRETGIK